MVSAPEPAIYLGEVRHRRLKPKAHAFTYPLFMAFLDVDRIPELCRVSPFLSYGRWNWAAFHEEDQFGDPALPLRERLRRDAEASGHALPEGPIYLLTHLRYLGICFNPVSYFYCHDRDGRLALIMAQVSNTPWRERHTYWMPVAEGQRGGQLRRAQGLPCQPLHAHGLPLPLGLQHPRRHPAGAHRRV